MSRLVTAILGRFRFVRMLVVVATAMASVLCSPAANGALEPHNPLGQLVTLRTRTGGGIQGRAVAHNDHGLVIIREKTPYVFAWSELEGDNAYSVQFALRASMRGGTGQLLGKDHFELGVFALSIGRRDLAGVQFQAAAKRDPSLSEAIRDATKSYRRHPEPAPDALAPDRANEPGDDDAPHEASKDAFDHLPLLPAVPGPSVKRRAGIRDAYLKFGREVQKVMGARVVLVETDHFLIWTDWHERYRSRIADWCEAMYVALCQQFDLDPSNDLFLAKCPVFCWRSTRQFKKFARHFDGYDGINAIGYTRSIEANGHVHVVLARQGRRAADFDRVACTLVHEGTHAFIHRLYSSRLIPHWVNEGYAELMAERVLGDRCPNGENAKLLAHQYARYDWPIGGLLESVGPLEVHDYALAHSFVAFLENDRPARFAGLIKDLKTGMTFADALAKRYDGLTVEALETQWRRAMAEDDRADAGQ